jgi:hypothetical protein
MMTIEGFKRKYGTRGLSIMIEELINRSPSFKGDVKLAIEIGKAVADLEVALEHFKSDGEKLVGALNG